MIDALQAVLGRIVAPMVRELNLRITKALPGDVTLALPVTPAVVHGGGVLCGQALMAAADTAMVVALTSLEPEARFRPMTTVQLSTSFLQPVAADAGEVALRARVRRGGRNLCYGDIEMHAADGTLVAHATTTYAYVRA
jgi:uncharacterized protein (TIGR00369 family)